MVIETNPKLEHQFSHWENFTNQRKFNHPVVTLFAKQRINFISKYVPFDLIDNALDVASGLGWSSAHMPRNIKLSVTDFSPNQLKYNPTKDKIVCKSDIMPFWDKSFSLVYGWDYLHHVPEPLKSVKEMARIAKDYLVLVEPNRNNLALFTYGIVRSHERGLFKFHKNVMYKLVEDIDFDVLVCETVGWIFAGTTPEFMLKIFRNISFKNPIFGISNIIICKRRS